MKRLLLAVALLPLVSFGAFDFDDSITVSTVRLYTWTDFDVAPNRLSVPSYNVNSLEQFNSVFSSGSWGFKINLRRTTATGYNYSFVVPSLLASSTYTNSANGTIGFCVSATTNSGVGSVSMSSLYFPSVAALYQSAATLFSLGYRGAGVSWFQSSGITSNFCVNVNYPLLVSDVMTSTNTLYRSTLLSYLNQIQSSLLSIGSSVGTINTDYKAVNSIPLNPTYQNLVDSMASPLATSSGASSIYGNVQSLLGGSNAYMGQNSQSEVASAIAELSRRNLQAVVAATLDPDSEFFAQSIDDILGNQEKFAQAVAAGGGASGIGSLVRDVKKLSTNDWASAVTNQLAENRSNITNELARNRASITNQLAHMFDDTPNSVGRAIRDTANNSLSAANAAGSIDERLQRGITVAVVNEGNTSVGVHLDGPVNIDSTQWQSLSTPIGGLSQTLDSLYGDLSNFYGWGDSSIDWSTYFHMMYDFKAQNHSDLSSLSNSLLASLSITSSVDRIYDYLSGYQSNSLYQILVSLTNSPGDYYFTRFRRANEFIDENELPFSIVDASDTVFGRGFDEGEFSNLNWFSRMELLLYQLQRVNDTTNVLEYTDLEGELDDSEDAFNSAGTDFVNASRRVVGLFGFITRFADSVKLAFQNSASPSTSGIVLLPGGSWLASEPLVLNVPISVQNALRLVFQCIWYLSAAVIGWRIVAATWDKVTGLIRWLWSVFDI